MAVGIGEKEIRKKMMQQRRRTKGEGRIKFGYGGGRKRIYGKGKSRFNIRRKRE